MRMGTLPMRNFQERKEAFERRFAHDEHQKFRAGARRNKLLGLWVAEQLGIKDEKALVYAGEVIEEDVHAGEAGVIHKVTADLKKKGITASAAEIKAKMQELMLLAIEQVKKEH